MIDTSTNPYRPPSAAEGVTPRRWLPRLLLGVVSLVLLGRGLLMAFAFIGVYLPGGVLSGSFMFALFLKDALYGITALIGATLLVFPSRAGWYFAVAHWVWYLVGDVVLVACAVGLGWAFPLSPGAPQLLVTLSLGMLGLAVLFWKPVMTCCGVSARRSRTLIVCGLVALALAFPLNGLALSRWW